METHEVLDLTYTPDEGQGCFRGTEKECYDFIKQQGSSTFMYKVVPVVLEDEICFHRTQDRVRTHRGYHCNNCGKRF
jgi:hypothetical protein